MGSPWLSPFAARPDFPILAGAEFAERGWDPDLRAQLVLAEFGASGWLKKGAIVLPEPDNTPAALAAEIDEMLAKAYCMRGARMGEIVQQAEDLTLYWVNMMGVGATTRPYSWQLVCSSMAVGHMVGMYYKNMFHRARPVQVYPTIMPAIVTPPHPSYPNNHAFQSHLISMCLMSATSPGGIDAPEQSPWKASLIALADRVGENREIAGLHFGSDARAARILLPQVWKLLKKGKLFRAVVRKAAAEWPAPGTTGTFAHRVTVDLTAGMF